MEDKHFEPVTARSLAIKLYDLALASSKRHSMEYEDCIVLLAGVLEPHIRKPSDKKAADPNWVAKEIAAICLLRGEDGDSKFRRVRELVSPYIRTIEELHQSKYDAKLPVSGSTDILVKFLTERITKKVEQYEQNRKYLELDISTDTTDKAWRLDKMKNILIEIDCIKSMLKDAK